MSEKNYKLKIPKKEAEKYLSERIELGIKLYERKISTIAELEQSKTEYKKWTAFNKDLLGKIFEEN
ncbi:hypothetical protein [Halothermothrix orenii]|uniref:hypothetical protein n=1 Tax=Halothermothrix orenii TaxID=31909 RepID=UPI00006BFDD5|nr:hypothetical protein [Halothermothrix orenii]